LGIIGWHYELVGVGGDFNVHFPCEKSGKFRQSEAMLDFLVFVFDQGLMDIPIVGGNFNWSNNCDVQS
jgi:hypothetical protein